MHSIGTIRFLAVICCCLLLAACGGGGAGDATTATTPNFRIVNLATGDYTVPAALPDLTLSVYTKSLMVFRRVPASATVPEFWIAVLELTQGQWGTITQDPANEPWKLVTPATTVGSTVTVDNKPAFGLIANDLIATLATWSTSHPNSLLIPSDVQWERACRAGTTTMFYWGNSLNPTSDRSYAVARETASESVGVRPVRENRTPNGLFLWDMHGNVREWVTAGGTPVLCGGSWSDNLLQCRSAARFTGVDQTFHHALSGARLILAP